MKPKDIFNLAVRLIGLAFFYQALTGVTALMVQLYQGVYPHFYFKFLLQCLFSALFSVGWPLALAIWMMRGAPWLMRLAYGKDAEPVPSAPESQSLR